MITFKVRRCGNGKRSRGFPKFVRGTKKFKNFEGSHMRMRGLYGGIGIVHVAEYLEKFLLAEVQERTEGCNQWNSLQLCKECLQNPAQQLHY